MTSCTAVVVPFQRRLARRPGGRASLRGAAAARPAGRGVRLRHGLARSDQGQAQAAVRPRRAASCPSSRARSASPATFSTRSATCITSSIPT